MEKYRGNPCRAAPFPVFVHGLCSALGGCTASSNSMLKKKNTKKLAFLQISSLQKAPNARNCWGARAWLIALGKLNRSAGKRESGGRTGQKQPLQQHEHPPPAPYRPSLLLARSRGHDGFAPIFLLLLIARYRAPLASRGGLLFFFAGTLSACPYVPEGHGVLLSFGTIVR